MYFGLNKLIKNILPKKLFYRSLIIIISPIILLQVVISTVFFDSLWIKANRGMTQTLVSEVRTVIELYENNGDKEDFTNVVSRKRIPNRIKIAPDKELLSIIMTVCHPS